MVYAIANDSKGNYGNNDTHSNITLDRGLPAITLLGPANNTRFLYGNVSFLYQVEDDLSLLNNCTLLLNGVANETTQRPTPATQLNFTLSDMPEAQYNWSVTCEDTAGNTNTSEFRNVTISADNEAPIITLLSPANETTVTAEVVELNYNVTDTHSAIKNCTLYFNDQENQTNFEVVRNITQTFVFADLPNADYTWEIFCYDNSTANNVAQSAYHFFTLFKATDLIVNVSTLQNEYDQGVSAQINVTVEDILGNRIDSNLTSDLIAHNLTNITVYWWEPEYEYRNAINITNAEDMSQNYSRLLPANYTINFTLDTSSLVSQGLVQADGDDLRIAFFDNETNTWQELDRIVYDMNTAQTSILFKTQRQVEINASNLWYYVYYGNDSVTSPPQNFSNVYFYYDAFDVNTTQFYNLSADFAGGSEANDGTVEYDADSQWMAHTAVSGFGKSLRRNLPIEEAIIEGYHFYDARAGIFNRMQVASHIVGDSYYTFSITSNIEGSELLRYNDGSEDILDSSGTTYSTQDEWYHLKLEVTRNSSTTFLKAYVNDALSLTANDTGTDRVFSGGFGLGQYQTTGRWDNLSVRLKRLVEPNISLGTRERFVERTTHVTGAGGEVTYNISTTNLVFGNYSVVGSAASAGYIIGVGETRFEVIFPASIPTIYLHHPLFDGNESSSTVLFNWTADALVSPSLQCNVTVDGVMRIYNKTSVDGEHTNASVVNLTEGSHTWQVNCTDTFQNSGGSAIYNFTVIAGPSEVNATMEPDNTSVRISWSAKNYTDTYHIFISDNYTTPFSTTPNVSNVIGTNYTDDSANGTTSRYYRVATVRGSVNKTSLRTMGKYDIPLYNRSDNITNFNLISIPFNLSNPEIENGTNNGYDLTVSKPRCIVSLWEYNNSRNAFDRLDYNGTAWVAAAGSEAFTHLRPGRGYWAEVNQTCIYTVAGEVPAANVTIPLQTGWNIVGWHTPNETRLPQNYAPRHPIDVNPTNSIITMNRYDAQDREFGVTVHYSFGGLDWGWFPAAANQDFLHIQPTMGYYFDATADSTWDHEPSAQLTQGYD